MDNRFGTCLRNAVAIIVMGGALAACNDETSTKGDPIAAAAARQNGGSATTASTGSSTATSSTQSSSPAATGSSSAQSTTSSTSSTTTTTTTTTTAAAGSANTAPTISGKASNSAVVGQSYAFQPQAADANGDRLTFTISNKPAWATFNAATGMLTGTPTAAGSFGNIEIAATDGKAVTALATFAITVTATGSAPKSVALSWAAPSENTDGTALTTLNGYKISYGTSSKNYTKTVSVTNPSITTFVVENLTAGATYYFSVSALSSGGTESALSSEVSKTLN